MNVRYVAFDLETAKVLPAREYDLMRHRPLGIACAAAALSDRTKPVTWHGVIDGQPAPKMSGGEVSRIVDDLLKWANDGYRIVSWNGLAFDFDVLAEESGRHSDCAELARAHVDMMFQAVCVLGHTISLAKAAEGMGLPGKTAGISGADAPKLWAAGRYSDVLKYAAQDAKLTLQLALDAERQGALSWITGSGRCRSMPLHSGWLCVSESCDLPLPDTSWMDDPPSRDFFTRWLGS